MNAKTKENTGKPKEKNKTSETTKALAKVENKGVETTAEKPKKKVKAIETTVQTEEKNAKTKSKSEKPEARRYALTRSFSEQVDDVLAGKHDPNYDLYAGETPQVLRDIGFEK